MTSKCELRSRMLTSTLKALLSEPHSFVCCMAHSLFVCHSFPLLRLAPLSEGRIHESGELQCTYHGWRFNEQGEKCYLLIWFAL